MTTDKQKELERLLGKPPTPTVPKAPTAHLPEAQPKRPELTVQDVEAMAQEATPQAFKKLYQIAMDDQMDARVQLAAIKEVLDRGLGKSAQRVEHSFDANDVIKRLQQAKGRMIDVTPEEDGDASR